MLRIGVIGTGSIAAVHLDGWRQMPGIELVGYYDILPEAAERAAQKYGGRVFGSMDDLFAAVDLVDICSPGTAHKENVLAAAAARKAIICEKPLARHLRDAVEMVETCERAGVPLFPAQVVRFFPMYRAVKDAIDSGAIGAPGVFRSARCGSFPRPGRDFSAPYYADFNQSGGVVLDVAVHDIDFARWCCGDVERVFARGLTFAGRQYQDHALITLRFISGAIGHIEASWSHPRGNFRTRIEVAGDGGLVEWDSLDRPALVAELYDAEQGFRHLGSSPSSVTDEPYYAELAHFVAVVEGRAEPVVTARDGLEAVRVALAAIESMRTGRPTTMRDFGG
ncbi:MAG: Gfo/Idh/MocA family oxidoreductase [Caldilinea sp.]|nr:Gfo/Idh/MocA family oxidoreductase [Caldilinea sp.]MCB9114543.1 Gfo/Idh/MocA family oxidoreductase [Caldilineaceae bacterium]MCB9121007.1 Gfo/Idh/MocA family oxidoreductase [Caldilineaceae bacterium]MCO5210633.1 Gfo/Idh/MocA family oxidoreductase [Caldilinea sp.]MCW5841347.1 Gfo/Idh/MocA family oxidoreductase [Caldilinea sp.]